MLFVYNVYETMKDNKSSKKQGSTIPKGNEVRTNDVQCNSINDGHDRKCNYCDGKTTYLATTKKGKKYAKWYINPHMEGGLICGKCYKNLQYHQALPPKQVRHGVRIARIANRKCHNCGGNTIAQNSKYRIWHKHPELTGKWFCAKCYANWIYGPKRKFKTKKERYEYLSELFRGQGNPMYGDHSTNLGRKYTAERNRKVSKAVKLWAKLHPEHYRKIGVLGALKARQLGLSGVPTSLEIMMENALKKRKIRHIPQQRYSIGIMDFLIPEVKIAVFLDGGVWHADPRIYEASDVLFFGRKSSKSEWSKITAEEIWKKDKEQNDYLQSKGYPVVRFWEAEVRGDIDSCIKIIEAKIRELVGRATTNE